MDGFLSGDLLEEIILCLLSFSSFLLLLRLRLHSFALWPLSLLLYQYLNLDLLCVCSQMYMNIYDKTYMTR